MVAVVFCALPAAVGRRGEGREDAPHCKIWDWMLDFTMFAEQVRENIVLVIE
jgi:hypothetical protein